VVAMLTDDVVFLSPNEPVVIALTATRCWTRPMNRPVVNALASRVRSTIE
jgi:hypothetical protein